MKTKFALSFTSLTLVIMMLVLTPAAFAQIATPDGHSTFFNPLSGEIPPGGTITATTGVSIPQELSISGPVLYHIQDNFPITAGFHGAQSLCQDDALSVPTPHLGFGPEDILSVLVDDDVSPAVTAGVVTNPVGIQFPGDTGVIQSISYQLGPIGANNPIVNTQGAPILYAGLVGVGTLIGGNPVWVQTIGPNPGSFGIPNAFNPLGSASFVVSCGCVDNNNDGLCEVEENDEVVGVSYQVKEELVGGVLVQLSTMSLLVAGAQANALWILPILGLAGTIIVIRKLQA